ncbi:hypothetical protein WICPIJ_003563 [Wickerhamomyces pijperi]|uniref:Uncharacterized protein n=1 Tax=Wickerhamomyces pijperi TaxID=599730 RepID=A0A9P8Q752_WICPI|nr:hypothetical protein WICPIJ_003563 [Wickerhamomyces pijperi]
MVSTESTTRTLNGDFPPSRHPFISSSLTPKAGVISVSALRKCSLVTFIASRSLALYLVLPSPMFTTLFTANDVAALTKPSISAPEKFFVIEASSFKLTSAAKLLDCLSALSIKSFLLVIPMTKMLFNWSTPSILANNWFTTLSATPVPSPLEPLCLNTESNSSKMIMCNDDSSPLDLYSASASLNKFLMFSSEEPTYLLKISGPLTIFGSLALSICPIFLAIKVLPVPGGP